MPPAAYPDPDRLRAANINPATGLATDYLNHYNEVAMLIATLADMPEMSDMILDWRPVGYPRHFLRSGFGDKGLAIAAWVLAERQVKQQFRLACDEVESRGPVQAFVGAGQRGGDRSRSRAHLRGHCAHRRRHKWRQGGVAARAVRSAGPGGLAVQLTPHSSL